MSAFKVKGILSFPNLFQPRAVQQGDDPKYGVTVLIADNDPQLATILALQEQEKQNGFPSGFPDTGKVFCKPSKDAPGYHQISGGAKVDQKPHLVGPDLQPIMDQSQVYAGAVAWVQFNTFTYNQPVNKGVSAGLNGVMITGEEGALGRLDGKPTVENMFGDVAGGAAPVAPAPVAPAPVAPVAPVAPAPAPAPAPGLVMTAAANGVSYEQYMTTPGWTDELLIANGLAVQPSFA